MMPAYTITVGCLWIYCCLQIYTPSAAVDPVQQALEYVFRVQESTCNIGTGEILPLQFDHEAWNQYTDPAIRTANLLSKFIVLYGSLDPLEDAFFFLLVRNNVHGDSLIFGSAIALEIGVYSKYTIFCPYAYKKNNTVRSHDISINYDYLDPSTEWYNSVKVKAWPNVTLVRDKVQFRVNNTMEEELEEVYPIAELLDGHWTNPYYDCGGGNIWMVTYSSPIFTLDGDSFVFQGVATIDIELTNIDINQCDNDELSDGSPMKSSGLDVFKGTHRCQETTKCSPVTGKGFVAGAYICECVPGFYFPHRGFDVTHYRGEDIESHHRQTEAISPADFRCVACAHGCDTCVDGSPCMFKPNAVLMIGLMLLTLLTMCGVVAIGIVTYLYRSNLVIKSASPIFLQFMCLGGFLMCCQFFALYPEASRVVCTIRIWPLHLGFAIMYGSLILKTWRVSVIFSVGAQKRVRLPDQVLLQRFAILVLVAMIMLTAWTVSKPPGTTTLVVSSKLKYYDCDYGPWEYAVLGAEVIFLLYGVYICFTVRKAPAHFNESKHITWAVYNAIILGSFTAFLSRFIVAVIEPNVMLVLVFAQIQVYVTVTILLIFAPKFFVLYKKLEIEHHATQRMPSFNVQTITGRIKKSQVNPYHITTTATQTD